MIPTVILNKELSYWLAALYLPDVGPRTISRWLEHFSNIENLFHASMSEWQQAGISPQHCQALSQPNWAMVEKDLAWAAQSGQHLISLADEAYPEALKETHDAPLVLYIKGDPAVLKQTQLAMVGARNATPMGLRTAEEFAAYLSQSGFAITSGLALGIDGASHRGALKAKGITIAVMGTGLNHIYPAIHRSLADEIVNNGGALVSEFPLNITPNAKNFPRRNRIICGLSKGTLVVEAALKSGSLITARYAAEQGREVFAIPGAINNPVARGCHYLIQQGAKLVETADDVISELMLSVPDLPMKPSKSPKARYTQPAVQAAALTTAESQLFDQIEYAVTPIDVIMLRSGLTAAEVSSILLSLELQGHIQAVSGGYIRSMAN